MATSGLSEQERRSRTRRLAAAKSRTIAAVGALFRWLRRDVKSTDIAQLTIVTVGVWIALVQLDKVGDGARSSASTAIFDQQLTINQILLESNRQRLMPYFFEDVPVPAKDKREADQVAGTMLDFFSNLEDQQEAGTFNIDEGWTSYMQQSFRSSPVLCEVLTRDLANYGGESGLLFRLARGPCAE